MKPIVYYDDSCSFCQYWINFLKKRDTQEKLQYMPLHKLYVQKTIPTKIRTIDSVILSYNNTYYYYSRAVLKALQLLGGIYILTGIFYSIPRVFLDAIYRYIAKRRKKNVNTTRV